MDVYYNYLQNYDWVAFFDFDEFLILEYDNNIKKYLSRDCFKNYNQILVNWKIYTDNNLVYDDGRTCKERFITPMDINKCVQYADKPENDHVKSIIRTNIKDLNMHTPHNFFNDILSNTTCNNIGNQLINDFWTHCHPYNHDLAHINHYTTKNNR